jgi:hypothetical protein
MYVHMYESNQYHKSYMCMYMEGQNLQSRNIFVNPAKDKMIRTLLYKKNAIFSPKIGKNRKSSDHNIEPRCFSFLKLYFL